MDGGRKKGMVDESMSGWTNQWKNEGMNKGTNEQMNERMNEKWEGEGGRKMEGWSE